MAKRKTKAPLPKRKTTALAVRPKAKAATPEVVITGLPAPQSPVGQLGELATVGALGLAELKLTPAEEAVLSRPVSPADVKMKPKKKDGPPEIPYLPHIVYTRWFNEAFGRTGWSIVPTAQPKKIDNLVLIPYLLYIHGVPVAAAMGEQEYIESNRQQTYGDVVESTVASALRRCAKRLGVGLELWDKDWLRAHGFDGPRRQQDRARRDDVVDAEPVATRAQQPDTLTLQQRDQLARVAERMGRPAAEVSLWLRRVYGVESSRDVHRSDFDAVKRALEAPGSLPMPGDGEP